MQIKDIIALDDKYYMGVFGKRFPICFVDGKGSSLIDSQGKVYTDFLGGIAVNCLGYSDPGLIQTLQDQVAHVMHTSNYFYVETQALAAEKLCKATGFDKVFFSNSGAEALEGAIKLARKYFHNKGQEKYEIITMKNSFHGRTLATLSATGQAHYQEPYHPLVPTFVHVPFNDLQAVKAAVTDKTCAILMEPIQGEGGVIPAQAEFIQGVRQLCNEKGILMIADEVQCGMGRTGCMLASQKYGVKPDIVTLAKALGGGVPIGAFLATEEVAAAFAPGDHGSTFGGNHLATAAANYVLGQLMETDMLKKVAALGAYFKEKLQELADKFPNIALEARGDGLMLGLQITPQVPVKDIVIALQQKGYIIGTAGGNTLRFVPPYVISKADIDGLIAALEKIFQTL